MSSILTNSSALTALQNLNNTQRALSKTQSQISTGLKVSSAADNATNWSVSTQMKSDNSVLSTVKDTLKQNSAMIKTATAALSQMVETITQIKQQLAQAKDVKLEDAATTDAAYKAINTTLTGLGQTLLGAVKNAAFNGTNLLNGSIEDLKIVSGFGSAAFTTINVNDISAVYTGTEAGTGVDDSDPGTTESTGVLVQTIVTADTTDTDPVFDLTALKVVVAAGPPATTNIDNLAKAADQALEKFRELGSAFGAAQNQIDAQTKFIEVLSDSLTNGVSSMVDADMNEASTRLQALQTQQQLGVQSLSIANQNSQMILKLFQ